MFVILKIMFSTRVQKSMNTIRNLLTRAHKIFGNTLVSKIVHNSSINEYKNMKLRENICFEIIN